MKTLLVVINRQKKIKVNFLEGHKGLLKVIIKKVIIGQIKILKVSKPIV